MQVAKTRVDLARLFDRFSLTQKKNYFSRFAGREFKARLDRRAGIEPGAVTSAQARAPQRCGVFQAAIASYEFITVTSHREAAFTCADKGHAIRKLIVVGIAREDRAFLLFEISHDVHGGRLAIHTKREFVVTRDRKPPLSIS